MYGQLKVENVKTMTGRKAFGFRGQNFWNHLDTETGLIESKPVFKDNISKTVCRDMNHPG